MFRRIPDVGLTEQNLACNNSKCTPTISVGNTPVYNLNVTEYRKALDEEVTRNFPEDQ